MNDEVHLVMWASQPDIQKACDDSFSTPEWNQPKDLPEGVHLASAGWKYTFDLGRTTCPACIQKAIRVRNSTKIPS